MTYKEKVIKEFDEKFFVSKFTRYFFAPMRDMLKSFLLSKLEEQEKRLMLDGGLIFKKWNLSELRSEMSDIDLINMDRADELFAELAEKFSTSQEIDE